jgi:hypothetical protein
MIWAQAFHDVGLAFAGALVAIAYIYFVLK